MQWLKEIPSHWSTPRLKYIMTLINGRAYLQPELQDDGKYRILRVGNFFTNEKWYYSDMELEDSKYCYPGDLLYAWSASFGPYIWSEEKVIYHYHIWKVVYNKSITRDYAYFLLLTLSDVKRRDVHGSAMVHLTMKDMNATLILLPPLAEQEKIVSYLECKTSKIDAYVAEKEKEIQLLQELKQKTIADAVTKGLNPDVKMKDSGISWIGIIPEHWEAKRAKFMFKKNKRERRPEDEVITCFRDGQVTLRKNRRLTGFTESEKYDGYQGVRKGDLVIHQMDAFAGSIGVSDSDGMGTSVYHCCTPIGDFNVYFYAHLIRQMALSGFIQSLYKGIRERSSDFSFSVFGNQYLIIPPRAEQDEIVAYIDEKCRKIDTLVSELQAEIDNMKEYKQRLIADCVTGQVNVQDKV